MNYLRGAVSAISAPYTYYQQLPPINPSTLTGAIDVIVVRRPADNGGTELACSPFHVRFGKFQVLRPGEKKVSVLVNGNPIPFDMKIGEAGEAFFVFETEDEVPDDLITSPILKPQEDGSESPKLDGKADPPFLDLDGKKESESRQPTEMETDEQRQQDERADAALDKFRKQSDHTPNVTFTNTMAYDAEGYHSQNAHDRERSDRTITAEDEDYQYNSAQDNQNGIAFPSSSRSPAPEQSFAFPPMRATSEPPPDMDEPGVGIDPSLSAPKLPQKLAVQSQPEQEYSWEWGAFPQPSPMKASFGKTGRIDDLPINRRKGKGKSLSISGLSDVWEDHDGRSHSLPPSVSDQTQTNGFAPVSEAEEDEAYGRGGRLSVSKSDPTKFRVLIGGKRIEFELSLVPDNDDGRRGNEPRDAELDVDDFDFSQRFEDGKVDLNLLLDTDNIVDDPALVLKWAGGQYIRQIDESPLIPALKIWRDDYIRRPDVGIIRPSSPLSDEEDGIKSGAEDDANEVKAEPHKPPTSSSWVRWWSRSRKAPATPQAEDRPVLKGTASAPLSNEPTSTPIRPPQIKDIGPTESTPILPSATLSKPPAAETHTEGVSEGGKRYAKTLRLTSDQLRALNLKEGANSITFSLAMSGVVACTARIFVWDYSDRILVSDIDGTITKSDALGHVFAMVGRDWTHLGVAKLYTDICRNGYKIMYLTSRAIGQADATRGYLQGIKQDDYVLPEGPVIMSPDRLIASLHREVIMRKPEVFKMACLRDILRLFGEGRNPFYAGFGNRITDALSYRSVNIPSSRIFTIDSTGEVKLELLELAGYKSSYIHMTDLVDQMFPPMHRQWDPEFTDFNYWRAPIQDFPLPDLSPPSPALSARSDTSNTSGLARLRNFSLLGGRSATPSATTKSGTSTPRSSSPDGPERSSQLRQMSSFERLSNTLGFSGGDRRSMSPDSMSSLTYAESEFESDVEDDELPGGKRRKRERTRSMSSIPGALDDMHFEIDPPAGEEDQDGDVEYEEEGEEGEEAAEEDFDDDIFAAGEMKNVPFL